MVKQKLQDDLKRAVNALGFQPTDIVLSIPKNFAFGDYSSNIALQLAKLSNEEHKQSAPEIANKIKEQLAQVDYIDKVEVAGPGFINIFLKDDLVKQALTEILKDPDNYGKNRSGEGQKIQVECISANPTGPLTLPNGRGGVIGDTVANILLWNGYKIEREYYVNDAGNQVKTLGESVLAAAGKAENKETHYQGEYVKELAHKFKDHLDLDAEKLGFLLADYLLEQEIKPAILRLGIHFDEYYSERSLYERGLIEKTAGMMREKGVVYEKDGALWFKSIEFGDEKDRVLITSESGRGQKEPTYFMADIAHHADVLSRGYLKRINVLGADHHGYGARIKGGVKALGFEGRLDIIFMQMVKLIKDGQEVRMSKRAGNFVTLDELLDQVDKDAVRFFFLMYSADSHIDFNLDLAKEKSEKNPVYYVQYAHARMSSILRKADGIEVGHDVAALSHRSEIALIKHLIQFPDLVVEIAQDYQVQKLTFYVTMLADLFHRFYEDCPVMTAETPQLQEARLALVQATRAVLASNLKLMGVNAPEKM